jgi:hypothetical protein
MGGGGNMAEGASLTLDLYYRDTVGNPATVGSTSIVHSLALFDGSKHLRDFSVEVAAVQPGDPWAGRQIGIRLLSTVAPQLAGGFWDVDRVRLDSSLAPSLAGSVGGDGRFGLTLRSEPGLRFEVFATSDLASRTSEWTSLGTVTNLTGSVRFTDPAAVAGARFYRVRQVP